MRFSTIAVWLFAGLAPLALAVAQAPSTSTSSQSGADAPAAMARGRMMGNQTMTFNNHVRDLLWQLKENLSGLKSENDISGIHKQVAQDQKLIDQLESTLDGHCGMSMGTMGSHMHTGQMMHGSNGNMMGGHMMRGQQMSNSHMSRQGGSAPSQGQSQN